MSSKSGSISLRSLSLAKSITEQTKDRFDAILKSALRKKISKSKEKMISEKASTSASSDNLVDEDIQEETEFVKNSESDEEEKQSKSFMLSKFLNDSSQNEVTVIKPPVPKPRTKVAVAQRRDSVSSVGTYRVDKENTVIRVEEDDSNQLVNTKEEIDDSLHNQIIKVEAIQNIDNDLKIKDQEIGDLLLHNSPTTSKIKIVASQNEIIEKADYETLTDELSSRTSSSRQTFTVKKGLAKERIDKKSRKDENSSDEDDSMKKRTKNMKPKPAKRNSKKDAMICKKDENELNYHHITEIIIHRTDKLLLNSFIVHPVVKIHIVHIKSGKYYRKSDKSRSVVFYYENDTNDYILPVMSGYYNLQEKRTFYPVWEESILLNEDFEYLLNENVIIFFEMLDFVPSNFATLQNHKDVSKGWFKIAFAFLKPVGKNNALNVNKQVRLQLFFPPNQNSKKIESDRCYLHDHWQSKKMKKYPSTLYVTMKKAISPKKVVETFRSKSALQREEIREHSEPEKDRSTDDLKQDIEDFKTKWLKKDKQIKSLPDECTKKIETFDDGCFVMKFSNVGQYLACSMRIDKDFYVIVHKVENFEEKTRFKNHQELIYSIVWSFDDKFLLTASADNTVAVWDFQKHLFLQILPHPNFVYTCCLNSKNTVATGCYDSNIRIWNFNSKTRSFLLSQELEMHKTYVTSLCFSRKTGEMFWSADANGELFEWEFQGNEFVFKRKIEILDLKETIINQIVLFQNEKKMVVHSRDSALRIISLINNCVVHWLYGALNTRVQTFCDISPCSSYIISGSENGLLMIWDPKTGKSIKTYEAYLNKSKTVHCVQFHPKMNMFAVSHYGSSEPILVYGSKNDNERANSENNNTKDSNEEAKETAFREKKIDFGRILRKMDELLID